MTDIKKRAVENGWREEIVEMVLSAWDNSAEPATWGLIANPKNDFEAASFALLFSVNADLGKPELSYKQTMNKLTSKREGAKSFTPQQYIRELCQNALDTITEEGLIINFKIDDDSMTFSHNGRSFQGPKKNSPWGEMGSLYEPGFTTKRGSFSSEGRFGIGFKGWMLFYDAIKHHHSNGSQQIKIEYEMAGLRIKPERELMAVFRGPAHSDNIQGQQERITSFTFSKPNGKLKKPTLQNVIDEWQPMINFVDQDVTINISVDGIEAVLRHECNDRNLIIESPETYLMKLSTLIDRGDAGLEQKFYCSYNETYNGTTQKCEIDFGSPSQAQIEHGYVPNCPECGASDHVVLRTLNEVLEEEMKEFIVIRSKITEDKNITAAIEQLIQAQQIVYSNIGGLENPWSKVETNDWYSQQNFTLGISMDNVVEVRPWLYSLAAIKRASSWPESNFEAMTNWLIDGPFFLSVTRQELQEGAIEDLANAAILKFGLNHCVGELASHLLELGELHKLNTSSAFDIILKDGARYPHVNPFHRLLLTNNNDQSNSPWGAGIVCKSYHSVFGGRTLYSNHSGDLIEANLIRRIPQSWKVAKGDGATTLTDWIQQQDTDILDEHWTMIPYSNDEEYPGFINEETAPLANLIPELKKEEIYDLLEKSQLLYTLKENYPDVIFQDWYDIELPKGTDCIIFGELPPNDPMINPLIDLVIGDNVLFESDGKSEISRGYKQKKELWGEHKGKLCLTVPNEATIDWWFDRLIWMANKNKTYLSSEVIEQLGPTINKSDSATYFVAKIHSYHKGSENELANSEGGFAIIPRTMNDYGSWWTIMPHSLAGWKIKSSYSGSKESPIWNILDISKFERIDVSNKIHIGSSNINEEPWIGKKLTVLASEPINPKILLTLMLNYCKSIPTSHESADDSVILTAEPWPKTKHLTEVLKGPSTHWTKLPTLSIIKETGTDLRYNEVGLDAVNTYNNSNFGGSQNTNSNIKEYYPTFYGHAMNLHSFYVGSKPQVLLRELGGQSLLNSDEFGSGYRSADLSLYHSLQLLTQINQDRYIKNNQKALLFLRIFRRGPQSKFAIEKAAIRSINESTALFEGDHSIPYAETQKLKEQRLCGFHEEETQSEIKWIISLETSEMSQNREQVYELINGIAGIEIIDFGKIVVQHIPNSGSLHPGLYKGVEGLLSHVLQVSEDNEDELIYHLLTEVGKIVKTIDGLLGEEIKLFDNIKVDETQKRLLLDKLEKAMEFFSDENNYLEQLEFLQKGLEFTNVKSWEVTKSHIIESYPDLEEMWKVYTDYGMLEPNPPAYKCSEKLSKFTQLAASVKQNNNISYLCNDDAKELFHLSLGAEKQEDATLWSIDEKGQRRICIIGDDLKEMLNAQSAKDSIIGRIDLNKVVSRCKPLEDGETAKIMEKWVFAQMIIGIYAYSKCEKHSNMIDYIPNIRAMDSTKKCEIFEGPSINLGKGGWDICGSVPVDQKRDAYMMLVTSDPENGNKGSLLTLLLKTKILERRVLKRITLNTPDGIQELAECLKIEVEVIEKLVKKIRSDPSIGGAKILNPWNKDEREDWISKFGQSPEWLNDKAEAVKKSSAKKLLRQYTSALDSLLNRGAGGLGPIFGEKTQEKIAALPDIRDKIKGDLYPNTASIIIDEPIIYAKGEPVPTMGNIRRHQEEVKSNLIERAGLKEFIGNQLFLSRYSSHRGTMTSDPYGLKQRLKDKTIQSEVNRLLKHKDAWGTGETILLRDVMQIGNDNYVSIRLHKYHAVCMVALDDALDQYEVQEND